MKEILEEAAEKWTFETNGHKWSNNDNTAGDNYGSFIAGAEWQAKRMYSVEEVIKALNAFSHRTGIDHEEKKTKIWLEQYENE